MDLLTGILFLTLLIFVLRTVVVLLNCSFLGFFINIPQFFFFKFWLSVLHWLLWIKVVAAGFFLSNLFTFVSECWILCFLQLHSPLDHLIFSSLQEQFLTHQHLNHFVFKLFKLVVTLTNLLMSSLSISAFKATKSFLTAKSEVECRMF